MGLAFGSYALWMLRWEDALELIGRTGYDGVELALMPEWPTHPKLLGSSDRLQMRGMLRDLDLDLPAFLENLQVAHPTQTQAENLDRLRRAIDLGDTLMPNRPPMFETVLGRSPSDWEDVKHRMVEEVGEWTRVAADGETVICFKPHAGDAVNNVERSLWLLQQVGSPYFRCTYDYSHLFLEGLDLAPTLMALLPVSPYLHLKDASGTPGEHRFLLPGDGSTDYLQMFTWMREQGYTGYATVEVSSQIHKRDDFDPIRTTRTCYDRMAAAFEQAKLPRP